MSQVLSSNHEANSETAENKVISISSSKPNSKTNFVNGVAGEVLLKFIERIEYIEEQKKALAEDMKEVYAEAKGQGFDTKIIRKIVSLRKRERAEVEEEETMLDIYMRAIGMLNFEDDEPSL